ncbi:MAG: hypothetical protein MJ227_03680 [Bacilli bacterium]|nr:hypothetical protein [Bacilli bacterium]
MNKKKKLTLFTATVLSAFLVAGGAILGSATSSLNKASMGLASEYELVANSKNKVTEAEATAGVKFLTTKLGNQVKFKLGSAIADPDGGFIRLADTGNYFELAEDSPIKGVSKISFTIKGRYSLAMSVIAGAEYGHQTIEKRFCSNGDNWLTLTDEIVFSSPVNYLRFENVDLRYFRVDNMKITYSCEEANERDVLEYSSNDILSKATAGDTKSIFDPANNYTVDFKNDDVGAPTSGYALKITGDSSADGWPTALLNLNQVYDFTNKGLSFNVKFVDLYKWISITLYDKNWSDVSKFEADITGSGWQNYTFPYSKLVNGLLKEKTEADLANIQLIKVCLNFDENKGRTQSVILDEFHPSEETQFVDSKILNLENYKNLDVGEQKNNTYSIDYTDFAGENSNSCKKVTFENITGDWGMTNTIVLNTGNDQVDFTNGVLEFDLKVSNNLMFGNGNNKHAWSLKVLSDWGSGKKSSWIDIHPKGASGYTNGYTNAGWFHITVDVASTLGVLGADSIRVYFAIGGISATNKADVFVKYDNITFTKNA